MQRDVAALLELARSLDGDMSDQSDDTGTTYVAFDAFVAAPVREETTLDNPFVAFVAVDRDAVASHDRVISVESGRDKSDKSDQSRWRRLWRIGDPNRRCWSCGARPDHRFPDGSPAYLCRHEPVTVGEPGAIGPAAIGHVHGYVCDAAGTWRCVVDYRSGPGCGDVWEPGIQS